MRKQVRRNPAFTLIELLIVVAIIAILAAIAVPNFLEAQTRSKISKAKADQRALATAIELYYLDYGRAFRDGNDPGIALTSFQAENGIRGDSEPQDQYGYYLRTYARWKCITTPVSYITSIPIDAFSTVIPYGYETWWDNANSKPYFALITCMGPDRDMDSAYDSPNCFYDASNGTKSNGDIFRAAALADIDAAKFYFGEDWQPNPE